MRIVLPIHQGASRGVGTIVRGLCTSLPEALAPGDELVLVGRRVQEAEQRRLQSRSRSLTPPGLRRLAYEQLYLPFAARGADLVHLCDHRPLLISGRRFLLTVHDVFFLDHPEWFPAATVRYRKAMLAAAIGKQPAVVACVSAYTRDRLLAHHPQAERSHVVVIRPGIEPAEDPGDDAHSVREAYFLTVAMVEPRKNHVGLLRAYRLARVRGLELRWKVVGALGERSADVVGALRSEPGVDVLGHVPDEELERLYRGARFLALPSHAEGFGFPPLEAMARGIPTVCSTGTALDETVDDAALRVPAGDVEGWAEALRRLSSNGDERRRLRELGRRCAARFSLAEAAQAYVAAYREALQAARRTR